MALVEITATDLLRDKVVTPAWYRLKLGANGPWTPSKDGNSNNSITEATIVFDADSGDREYEGVPIQLQFNDKPGARGFILGYLKALGVDVQAGRIDLAAADGMEIDAYVENDTYDGRVRNRVNHKYRAPKK